MRQRQVSFILEKVHNPGQRLSAYFLFLQVAIYGRKHNSYQIFKHNPTQVQLELIT